MTPANIAGPRSQFTRSLRGVQALIQAMTGAGEERLRRREYMARETERELARGERRQRFEWEKTRAAEAFGAAEEERKQRMAMSRAQFREEYGYEPGAPGVAAAAPVSGVGAPAEITGTSRKPVIERLARKQAMSAEEAEREKGSDERTVIAAGRQAYREAKVAAAGMTTKRARELEEGIPAPRPVTGRPTAAKVRPSIYERAFRATATPYEQFLPEEWANLASAYTGGVPARKAEAEATMRARGVDPTKVLEYARRHYAAAPGEAELAEYIARQRGGPQRAGSLARTLEAIQGTAIGLRGPEGAPTRLTRALTRAPGEFPGAGPGFRPALEAPFERAREERIRAREAEVLGLAGEAETRAEGLQPRVERVRRAFERATGEPWQAPAAAPPESRLEGAELIPSKKAEYLGRLRTQLGAEGFEPTTIDRMVRTASAEYEQGG